MILAGVYDIKNLKLKIRPEEEHKYNSPWNIAARFNLDMSFSAEEISLMLGNMKKIMEQGWMCIQLEHVFMSIHLAIRISCQQSESFLMKRYARLGQDLRIC